jgi:Protein of unknown function (DUF1254)
MFRVLTRIRCTPPSGLMFQRKLGYLAFQTWVTALLHDTHAGRLDERVQVSRHTHHGQQATEVRHHGQGVTEIKAPTGLVWILGRIYCTGAPGDYAKVHALQDKFSVVPLSSYGKRRRNLASYSASIGRRKRHLPSLTEHGSLPRSKYSLKLRRTGDEPLPRWAFPFLEPCRVA